MIDKTLVVISYYDRRPIDNLLELLDSLYKYPSGEDFDIAVVVNRTKNESISVPQLSSAAIHYRHNIGMNIGAWDYGWRQCSDYRHYLFLQDECYAIRENWLAAYKAALESPKVGMVGESLNTLWNKPWRELRKLFSGIVLPEHRIGDSCVNRVDFYLNFFRANGVDAGVDGQHLRSVVWFFSGDTLKKINGFLIGRNYGECIAAEIATSKKVESLGCDLVQVNQHEEFFYIRHLEYNQDCPGSPYAHDVKYVDYASVQRLLESKEKQAWSLLKHTIQKIFRLGEAKTSITRVSPRKSAH
jgi:hypothetical protein